MKKIIAAVLAQTVILSGCATPVQYVATGGSRADATVELSYEYGIYTSPVVDESQGIAEASSRCRVWGYNNASAFGGAMQQCTAPDLFGGCNRWRVTKSYQCTGNGGTP